MMRKMRLALGAWFGVASLAALCAATPANAIVITESVNPADTSIATGSTPSPCPTGFTCTASALTFIHDITDSGFVVGLDTITSATIAIHLTDQVVTGLNNETYRFDIGGAPQAFTCGAGNCVPNVGVTDVITLDPAALADLSADGVISVKLSSLSGNFLFADSLLTVQITKAAGLLPAASGVPEPSTLLLLGAGFAGLGSRLRRRS